MPRSLSHTRADRAVDQFLRQTRFARELGIVRQLVDDVHFDRGTVDLRGEEVVNFGLCCYLALGDDPRLVEAAIEATRRFGASYSSSMAYTALPLYRDLKERLQAMLGAPVMVAANATLAHQAALPVLVRGGDTVVVDGLAHASLLAVMPTLQAGGATVEQISHNDLGALADHAAGNPGRTWYVFDGLYSMHGDTAPAEDLRRLLDSNPRLWMYCDDAHGLGWSGERGRGEFLQRAGWHERLVVAFGLAKSFGTMGGVVATPDPDVVEMIEFNGGPMVFSGPLPPATLGASIASADIHLSDELAALQQELLDRIDLVHDVARSIGLPLSATERTPLWFLPIGPTMNTVSVTATMLKDGYFLNVAAFPAVPRGKAGVRFTVTRYLDESQIEAMLTRLNEVRLDNLGDEDVVDLTALEDAPIE